MPLLGSYSIYEEIVLKFLNSWMIFVGFIVFGFLLKYEAPYGRYSNYKFGMPIPAKLSWCIMEIPSIIMPLVCFLVFIERIGKFNYIFLLYMIHYSYRSLIYPFLIQRGNPVPCYIGMLALIFNVYNGSLQFLGCMNNTQTIKSAFTYLGIIGFFFGLLVNIISDYQLRQLRNNGQSNKRYKIPRGWFFEYVSCANYFGEIIEWWSYAVAAQSLESVAFALFTCFNLIPRALSHHRWYLENFKDYPRNRKAVLPGVL